MAMVDPLMQIRHVAILFSSLCVFASGTVFGQDPLDELYGQAVHSYFRGDIPRATELLNDVIAAGTSDPRAYFFRGLCEVRSSGAVESGTPDFEKGAQLEVAGKKVVNVGKSLERIQGHARIEIERVRTKTRLASRAKMLEMQRNRYEETKREAIVVPPKGYAPPAAPPKSAPNNPFETDSGLTRGEPKPMDKPAVDTPPAETEEGDDASPFGLDDAPMDPADETVPASDDPFSNP